jgi:tetratricopeptide (TPR) repeat protein
MIRPHAFVAMPFGTKPGADGKPIDFNRVYREYIAPALDAAGLECFRADEEIRAGDIKTDMFQELLVADLVVADLTIDNPNVWYELGVRHALRARGVIIVSGGQTPTAFDLYTDRKLRYGLKDGGPDPETLKRDTENLAEMIKATMESWHGRMVSPVYHLMPNLQEPEWKRLRIGDVREFWEKYDSWESRLQLARKEGRIGDMLVLAEEAPVAAFRADAWIKGGEALRKAERFRFALEHLEKGLEIEPENLRALQGKGMCLQRLALAGVQGHSLDRARDHYRETLKLYPTDPETWALLGRVDKDAWVASWRQKERTPEQMREDAAYEDALLRAAIDSYGHAFRANPGHYYSGINALTLIHLARHLTQDKRYDNEIGPMAGALRFGAQGEPDPTQYFWSYTTLADLEVLVGTPQTVTDAYKEAIAKNERDWFALNSSRGQLQLLQDLGFRPETVGAGLAVFDRAIGRLSKPEDRWEPRQVFLFSGHRMDAPDRQPPRFPAAKEVAAAQAIEAALDRLGAGAGDVSFCQAAAGGDLLFLEACQNRGVRCRVLMPFDEPQFIEKSIAPSAGGDKWRDRFFEMKAKLIEPIRIMPDELGPAPAKNADPFERCNLWSLYSALACGIDKLRFVTLWDGGGGDGPGGTAHMFAEAKRRTGRVTWLDTRTL